MTAPGSSKSCHVTFERHPGRALYALGLVCYGRSCWIRISRSCQKREPLRHHILAVLHLCSC